MPESFGKRLWRLVYPLLTYTGVSYIISYIGLFGCIMWEMLNNTSASLNYTELTSNALNIYNNYVNEFSIASYVCIIPLLILYMNMDRKRRKKQTGYDEEKKASWQKFIILPVLGALVCAALTFIIIIGGWEFDGMNNIDSAYFCGRTAVEIVSVGILLPVTNELLFRGLLYNRLKETMPLYMAAVLISLFNALYSTSFIPGLYSFIMSLILIYVYEKYHSIIAPVLVSAGASVLTVLQNEKQVLNMLYKSWTGFRVLAIVFCLVSVFIIVYIDKSSGNHKKKSSTENV